MVIISYNCSMKIRMNLLNVKRYICLLTRRKYDWILELHLILRTELGTSLFSSPTGSQIRSTAIKISLLYPSPSIYRWQINNWDSKYRRLWSVRTWENMDNAFLQNGLNTREPYQGLDSVIYHQCFLCLFWSKEINSFLIQDKGCLYLNGSWYFLPHLEYRHGVNW